MNVDGTHHVIENLVRGESYCVRIRTDFNEGDRVTEWVEFLDFRKEPCWFPVRRLPTLSIWLRGRGEDALTVSWTLGRRSWRSRQLVDVPNAAASHEFRWEHCPHWTNERIGTVTVSGGTSGS